MMKLSIIIPAFNAEAVISRCLKSVYEQNMSENDYEVIIVDDGSTDNTYSVITSLINKKSNVKLLRQNNQRQGAARNNALKIAQGEYIWFVDSDDYIESNCLLYLYKVAKENDLDLLFFNYYRLTYGNKFLIHPQFRKQEIYDKILRGKDIINLKSIYLSPCFCLYRKEYLNLNNIRFKEGLVYEDNEFMIRAYYYASRVYYIKDPLYYTDVSEHSTTRTQSPIPIFDLLAIVKYMLEFTESIKNNELTKKNCSYYTAMTFNTAIYRLRTQNSIIQRQFIERVTPFKKRMVISMINSQSIKYIFEGFILSLSPQILLFISSLRDIFKKVILQIT